MQPVEGVYPEQELRTKILLLFFYTIFHGIMMLLAGVPFFFYRLTGERKEKIHAAVLERRKLMEESLESQTAAENAEEKNIDEKDSE